MQLIILFLLGLNQVFSWDIGVLYNNKIELYNKQNINKTISDPAFENMYVLTPSYKRDSFSFFNSKYNYSYLFTYRPKYDRFDFDGKIEKEQSIQSMDIDVEKNLLFWLDINKGALFKSELVLDQEHMDGVLLTYFTKEIVRDIVVNDINETIYWIASNVSHSFLIVTNYTGFEQRVLVTQKGPMSFLAIDKEEAFLYWSRDIGHSYDIEKYNINTGLIQVVKKKIQNQPCHLKISKNYLFWMDWKTFYIWKAEKNNDFMTVYLSFADNAVSFFINENTIDEVIKNDIDEVIKNVVDDENSIFIKDDVETIQKTSDDEFNKKIFQSFSDNKIKNIIFWTMIVLELFIGIVLLIMLFTLSEVKHNEQRALLNTYPLNHLEV